MEELKPSLSSLVSGLHHLAGPDWRALPSPSSGIELGVSPHQESNLPSRSLSLSPPVPVLQALECASTVQPLGGFSRPMETPHGGGPLLGTTSPPKRTSLEQIWLPEAFPNLVHNPLLSARLLPDRAAPVSSSTEGPPAKNWMASGQRPCGDQNREQFRYRGVQTLLASHLV